MASSELVSCGVLARRAARAAHVYRQLLASLRPCLRLPAAAVRARMSAWPRAIVALLAAAAALADAGEVTVEVRAATSTSAACSMRNPRCALCA
jgi:hypothetical protein